MDDYLFSKNNSKLDVYSLSKSYISKEDILEDYKDFWGI